MAPWFCSVNWSSRLETGCRRTGMTTDYCQSGKVQYQSRSDATRSIRRHFVDSSRNKTGHMRTYHCPICDHWHITSERERRTR